jgi:hypothetical protein
MSKLPDTQRVVIYQCIRKAAAPVVTTTNWISNIPPLHFKPDYCNVVQFNLIGSTSTNSMYILNSSLNNEPLLCFNGFNSTFYQSPTPFRVYNNIQNQLSFNIQQVSTTSTLDADVVFAGDMFVALILEFSKIN